MFFDPKSSLEEQREQIKILIAPISAESPAGANTRVTPEGKEATRNVESLFKDALVAERKLDNYRLLPDPNIPPPTEPRWNDFIDRASDYLRQTSKDLPLAILLVEAAVRDFGLRGLLLGIELLSGLVEKYWPDIYPSQDADSTKSRRFTAWRYAYDWPDRLAPRLETICKLTSAGTTFAEYAEAARLDNSQLDPSIREKRISDGAKTTDIIRNEINQKPDYVRVSFQDLEECRKAIQELTRIVKEKCVPIEGHEGLIPPTFSSLADALTQLVSVVKSTAPAELLAKPEQQTTSNPAVDEEAAPAREETTGSVSRSGGMTREAALKQLLQLANFFRRTEPHSPISYTIEQVVRWGNMSLPDLMAELIADSASRKSLFERTGLPEGSSDRDS